MRCYAIGGSVDRATGRWSHLRSDGVTSMNYRMAKTNMSLGRLDFGHVVAILIVVLGIVPFLSAGLLLQP